MFSFVGYKNLDPDFGWHIGVGKYIRQQGIPQTDPFSYTMPSYPFIDHEWMTNVAMSWIWENWGYSFEVVVFGLLAGVLFLLLVPKTKVYYGLVPFLLGAGALLTRGGVRPQVLDWIFLAGLLRLLWAEKIWKRWRWVVIPMFGIWANLHGGFALGPVLLGLILIVKFLEERKIDRADILVWVGGIVITGVNPYGYRIWHEVWMQMTDSNLRSNIAEWRPFWVKGELGVWMLVVLSAMMTKLFKLKLQWWKISVAAGLFIAGLSSLRHISLLQVFMIMIATDQIEAVSEKTKGDKIKRDRTEKFYLLMIVIGVVLFIGEAGVLFMVGVVNKGIVTYPVEAVEHLKVNNYPGEVLSDYGWGGYLIWKYPEKKVFIDGRMPSWRWKAPESESDWAFKDFLRIKTDGDFEELFEKFNVRTVLLPNYVKRDPVDLTLSPQWWIWLNSKINPKGAVDLVVILAENGWVKVYEDKVSVVLIDEKNKN